MMKKLLAVLLLCSMLLTAALAEESLYAGLTDLDFYFSSGVGGWFTLIKVDADGSFAGDFHDSEMGDIGDEYPNGTVYGCAFRGRFGEPVQVNNYTWRLPIAELTLDEGQLPETIEDGIRYITTDAPYGLENTDALLLYLPGAPVSELPEGYLSWAHLSLMDEPVDALPFYGLYNEKEECGFVGEPALSDEEIIGGADDTTAIILN